MHSTNEDRKVARCMGKEMIKHEFWMCKDGGDRLHIGFEDVFKPKSDAKKLWLRGTENKYIRVFINKSLGNHFFYFIKVILLV